MFTSRQLLCCLSIFTFSTTVLVASEAGAPEKSCIQKTMEQAKELCDKYEPMVANTIFQFPLNPLNTEKKRIEKTRTLEVPETDQGRRSQVLYACSENSKQERMKGYGNILLGLCALTHKLRVFGPTLLPTVMIGAGGLACCGLAASRLPHYDLRLLLDLHEERARKYYK